MPTPRPGSNIQILSVVTDRHIIPVKDVDRTDQSQPLYVPALNLQPPTGDGAPVDYVAPEAATLVLDSLAANSDLTFTATEVGADGNDFTVAVIQPVTPDEVLDLTFDGTNLVINLPTDGGGAPVAATAAEVKAAWDGGFLVAPPNAYPYISFMTVTVEGTGAGAVDAVAANNLAGGVDEVLGTGNGLVGLGGIYVDNTTPAIYVNTGTADAPVWVAA